MGDDGPRRVMVGRFETVDGQTVSLSAVGRSPWTFTIARDGETVALVSAPDPDALAAAALPLLMAFRTPKRHWWSRVRRLRRTR